MANVGGALVFTTARPSGAAMTVSAPFRTMIAPLRCSRRARAFEFIAGGLEQTRELAVMRRQNTGSLDGLGKFVDSAGEHGEGIGVEQHRAVSRQHGKRMRTRRLADAGAGADQEPAIAGIAE